MESYPGWMRRAEGKLCCGDGGYSRDEWLAQGETGVSLTADQMGQRLAAAQGGGTAQSVCHIPRPDLFECVTVVLRETLWIVNINALVLTDLRRVC